MCSNFDYEDAKIFLRERDRKEKEKFERERQFLLQQVKAILIDEFKGKNIAVYLVGSILRPYFFYSHSDVDIVLENFNGDRFEIWTRLEEKIGRNAEIILFEKCHFKQYILTQGLKVV